MSYVYSFTKKRDGHKICTSRMQSLVSISFSCNVSEFKNTGHSQIICPWEVIRTWFHEIMRRL
ncbi:hypothetical protein BHE74_00057054 [Ensete ventricosum]|nr:hypothetical protein BHE74_00057054 [Ensete ventricosum]